MTTEQPKTTFADNTGKEYSLKMNLGLLRDSENWLGIDLVKDNEKVLESLYGDFSLLIIIAVELTRGQREGLSDDDFVKCLEGEVLDEVLEAFLNAWALCLPKLQRETLLAMNQRASQETGKVASKLSSEILTSQKLTQQIDENIAKYFGE